MIPNDYEVYISEDMVYISEHMDTKGDPTSFKEATRSPNSSKWLITKEDGMTLSCFNQVLGLRRNSSWR